MVKDGIEKCVDAMLSYPNADFGMYSPLGEKDVYKIESIKALRHHLFVKPFLMIGPGGTISRRTFFTNLQGYPEKYGPANDMYFNLKACTFSDIVMIPFDFMIYRRHAAQEINNYHSYLYNNYCYFRDAVLELSLPVSAEEREWLIRKNKRRFVVSVLRYLSESRNLIQTIKAIRRANFSLADAISGIFHL
jgi:hypothetical protein